jgi:pilus assembly protein CpaB
VLKRPAIFLGLSALAAVLAAVLVFSALQRREAEVQRAMAKTTEIVVAARDLPLGTKLSPLDLKITRWARDSIPPGAYTDPASVTGRYVKNAFLANEPVVASKLFTGEKTAGVMPLLIPSGMRAMSVPVDEVGVIAGFVKPKSRVDILVAMSGSGPDAKPFSKVVLQNVEVLAVAQEIDRAKDEPQVVKVVTLLVTPVQAEKLALASREGTLRLAMRNFADVDMVATPGADVSSLLSGDARSPVIGAQGAAPARAAMRARGAPPVVIDVLRDGSSAESVSFVNSKPAARTAADSNRGRPLTHNPIKSGGDAALASDPANPSAVVEERAYAPFEKTVDVFPTTGSPR